jgi:hypothetical protein
VDFQNFHWSAGSRRDEELVNFVVEVMISMRKSRMGRETLCDLLETLRWARVFLRS